MPSKSNFITNDRIRSYNIFLIGENGSPIGEVTKSFAMDEARRANLDLVQMSYDNKLPVCKLLDYGKMKYETSKNKNSKNNKTSRVKEIFYHINTSDYDLDTKKRHVKDLLSRGYRVKFGITLKGRQVSFFDKAKQKLMDSLESFSDMAGYDGLDQSKRSISVILKTDK